MVESGKPGLKTRKVWLVQPGLHPGKPWLNQAFGAMAGSSAAVVPQSKSTELCSSAAVVPHKGNLLSCVVLV